MKKTLLVILAISIVTVAAIGMYVAAEEAPNYQQGKPAAAAAPTSAQAFAFKRPIEILSEVSGKTVDELRTLVAGDGVWAVIEKLGVKEKFINAFTSYKLSYADYLVSVGKVTKEEAEAWKTEFKARVAAGELGKGSADCDLNLGMGSGMMRGRGNRGCGGCGMNGNGNGMMDRNTMQRKGMMGGNWN